MSCNVAGRDLRASNLSAVLAVEGRLSVLRDPNNGRQLSLDLVCCAEGPSRP